MANNQVNEVQSVLQTLIETTDHLTTLAESEELEQCVYIFASLIEGTEAVFKAILTLPIDVAVEMKNIEKVLMTIAQDLENEELDKASTQSGDSLRPEFVSMIEKFSEV